MYNLQWNGAGLSVLPSEDDIYTQHVKLKLSCKTQIVHKCNFSSQDYTSLPPFPIMHTTYSLHTQLHTDGGLKLQKYDIWCEQFFMHFNRADMCPSVPLLVQTHHLKLACSDSYLTVTNSKLNYSIDRH